MTFKPLTNSLYNIKSTIRYSSPLDRQNADPSSKPTITTNTTPPPQALAQPQNPQVPLPVPKPPKFSSISVKETSRNTFKRNFRLSLMKKLDLLPLRLRARRGRLGFHCQVWKILSLRDWKWESRSRQFCSWMLILAVIN